MARKGENIYKRKDGRWEARYILGYRADGTPHYGYCYASTYHEAQEKVKVRRSVTLPYARRSKEARGKLFIDYCDEWIIINRTRVKESTFVKYRSILEKHLKPYFGNKIPEDIKSTDVESFTVFLLDEEKLSPKTAKDILILLKSLLKYIEITAPVGIKSTEVAYPREEKKEMRVLSAAEQKKLTDYLLRDADEDPVKFGILLAMTTGLRLGELCALKWSDISSEDGTISIERTIQRIAGTSAEEKGRTRLLVSGPKSSASSRVIPMSERTLALCEVCRPEDPEAFVLTGSSGKPAEPRFLQYRLKRYTADCGLEGVHFHTLRHSFATRCVEVDFDIKSLSEILGHANPQITLARYVHSSLALKKSNMKKLSSIGY